MRGCILLSLVALVRGEDQCNRGDMCSGASTEVPGHGVPEDPSLLGGAQWGEEEGSGSAMEDCWAGEMCAPNTAARMDGVMCHHCPSKEEPQRWTHEHLQMKVDCRTDTQVSFNLSLLSQDPEDPWVDESWTVELIAKDSNGEVMNNSVAIDLAGLTHTGELRGLCAGEHYTVCVQLTGAQAWQVCQEEPCHHEEPPPANPHTITVTGGVTYMDVHWQPVEPQCTNLRYEVLVNGSQLISPGTDQNRKWVSTIDMSASRLDPGLHNVTVKASNLYGQSEDELTYASYETFRVIPPHVLEPEVVIEDGQLVATIAWEHSLNFKPDDITAKNYFLILHNQSSVVEGEHEDEHHISIDIEETSYRVNLSAAEGIDCLFSLQTHLGEEVSETSPLQPLFPAATQPGPPEDIDIRYSVDNKVLQAHVSWQYNLTMGQGFAGLKTTVHQTNGEESLEPIDVLWPASSIELPLKHWEATIGLQTAVLDVPLGEAQERQLFRGYQLFQPTNLKVEHRSIGGQLVAVVSWDNGMPEEFTGLQTIIEVTDDQSESGSEVVVMTLPVDYSGSEATVTLASVQSWSSRVALHTAAMGGRGQAAPSLPLFSEVELTAPGEQAVEVAVEDGTLRAEMSWANTVLGGRLTSPELGTQVRVLDRQGNILDTLPLVPYPGNQTSYLLQDNHPWDVTFTLVTAGKEEFGNETVPAPLFHGAEVPLSVPEGITLEHRVEGSIITAHLAWKHGVPAHIDSIDQFRRLQTKLRLYTDDGQSSAQDLPNDVTESTIGHEETELAKWTTSYTLSTCVATQGGQQVCGGESQRRRLFPDTILKPPKNIRVTHGYDEGYMDVYAEISWENDVAEDFTGLVTVLKSWVPTGAEVAGRSRRSVEDEFSDILMTFSDTSRKVYLSSMRRGTMFSLQTAMGNASGLFRGQESAPMAMFDEALVRMGPPSGITIEESSVVNGTLYSNVSWEGSTLPLPPPIMTIYDKEGKVVEARTMGQGEETARVELQADLPWDAQFTLKSTFTMGEDGEPVFEESARQRLFQTTYLGDLDSRVGGAPQLTPPEITNITVLVTGSSYRARVEWNLTMEKFDLLHTVVSVWVQDEEDNTILYEQTTVEEGNTLEVEVDPAAAARAQVSLQSSINGALSPPGERRMLFAHESDFLYWLLMIIILTILLLLYILATYFCLRRLCNKSGRLSPAKARGSTADAEPGTPGIYSSAGGFSERKPLMANRHSKSGVSSDAGSDHTDQSLLSDEHGELCSTPISPSLLYPGDSMVTLNKFNEDDDDGFFLGGFNEDGSFIGDYMDNDPDTNRAVMNRLVGFQQLLGKKFYGGEE